MVHHRTKILSLFDDQELRKHVESVLDATEDISKKERVSDFHHCFYIPDWIGLIQQSIVEKK